MIRLALAAIVFCSTFVATLASTPAAPRSADGSTLVLNAADQGFDCAPVDESGEWRPHHGASTSITDGIWKWRSVHALTTVTALTPHAGPVVDPTDKSHARAARAPAYLLHTPLLI